MHSETIDDRLVAVEKIDSQKPIHARSSNSATKVRKIPGAHGMCARLVEPNLKIFDFASLNIFTGQPHHTIDIPFSSPFVSGRPSDLRSADAITVWPAPVSTIKLAERPLSLHET